MCIHLIRFLLRCYIPHFANLVYFTLASSYVVTPNPYRCNTRSISFHLVSPAIWWDHYIPFLANLEYISSASCLEYGASPIRSKILSELSPLLYPRTTCVCRNVFGVSSFAIPVSVFRSAKSIWMNRFE